MGIFKSCYAETVMNLFERDTGRYQHQQRHAARI